MRQVFEPYWKWEDFKNGMFDPPPAKDFESLAKRAAELLADSKRFLSLCRLVVKGWPVATAVNLTNTKTNRRAWLGQAACCFDGRVPEIATRAGWKLLTDDERAKANQVADEVIYEYEVASNEIHRGVEVSRLF